MLNQLCRLAKTKYVCKLDAHCSIDEGWDLKMLKAFEEVGDDVVMTSTMKNLWAFNWVCECGRSHYQDKGSVCTCGKTMKKDICWIAKKSPNSTAFCFDSTPHFQYHNAFKAQQKGLYVESMSLQGSCFMLTRENWWKFNICDEEFGSWGSQGIEVACKFWLSGGRVLVNRDTWYAHMFRTKQAAGFGFPYPMSNQQQERAKQYAKDLFFNNKWPLQTRELSWLVERFCPPGWSREDVENLKKEKK